MVSNSSTDSLTFHSTSHNNLSDKKKKPKNSRKSSRGAMARTGVTNKAADESRNISCLLTPRSRSLPEPQKRDLTYYQVQDFDTNLKPTLNPLRSSRAPRTCATAPDARLILHERTTGEEKGVALTRNIAEVQRQKRDGKTAV